MPRKGVTISKTTIKKIEDFYKNICDFIDDSFKEKFKNVVEYDVKNVKECSEKSIVDLYIEIANKKISNNEHLTDNFWDNLKQEVRKKLIIKTQPTKLFDNNIDIYFNEVRNEYIKHPQKESDDLEFIPENRDIFIKNNLKLVIECAKRYRGLGLPFEDLIQVGNQGLLAAFDKFDKNRANLRKAIIKDIESSMTDKFSYEDAEVIIRKNFVYSKNLDKTLSTIPKEGFESKEDFIEWAKVNVKTAVFASVAFHWIRANIISEINRYGRIINIPKSFQQENGSATIIRLDSLNPHTDDNYHDNQISDYINKERAFEFEGYEDDEHNERIKEIVNELLVNLNGQARRIMKRKFGIGYPCQMNVNDIATSENLPVNKVKTIINNSLKTLAEKAKNKAWVADIFS